MKQIVVLGNYGGGCSRVAGILEKLGVDMGRHENEQHNYYGTKNKKELGYYECKDSVELCSKLRDMCYGKTWTEECKHDHLKILNDNKANQMVQDYIKKRNEKDIWGVKDSKMLNLYPLFHKNLTNPYVILVTNTKDGLISHSNSERSFRRNDIKIEDVIDQHLETLEFMRSFIKKSGVPLLERKIGSKKADDISSIKEIADFIGVPITNEAIEFFNQ